MSRWLVGVAVIGAAVIGAAVLVEACALYVVVSGVWRGLSCAVGAPDVVGAARLGCTISAGGRVSDDIAAEFVVAECAGRARPEIVGGAISHLNRTDALNTVVGNTTPLHACSAAGCLECCRLLVAAGASPRSLDGAGHTPFDVAKTAGVASFFISDALAVQKKQRHTGAGSVVLYQ